MLTKLKIVRIVWWGDIMPRVIKAEEARRRLGEVIEDAHYRGTQYLIEKTGKPMAVVIGTEEYAQIEAHQARLLALEEEMSKEARAKYETAQEDLRAGRLISHDELLRRLQKRRG